MSCDSEITMTKITGGHLWFVCMCVCREWGWMWPSQRRRWQGFSLQRQARAQHRLKHGRNQRGDRQHTGVFRMHVCKLVCRVVEEGPVLLFTSDLRTTSLGSCTLCFPVKFKTFRRGEQRWSSVDVHRWSNIQASFMKLFHFPQLQGRFWSSEGLRLLVEYLPFCGDLTDSSATTPQGRSVLSCYPSGISTD